MQTKGSINTLKCTLRSEPWALQPNKRYKHENSKQKNKTKKKLKKCNNIHLVGFSGSLEYLAGIVKSYGPPTTIQQTEDKTTRQILARHVIDYCDDVILLL